MKQLVKVFNENEFIGDAFIEGLKYVKGDFGWFTTLELLTTTGEKIDGWKYNIRPYPLMLEYMANESTKSK